MKRLLLLAVVVLSGCYRIHYVTHAHENPAPSTEVWHHNFIDGIFEASDPVNVSAVCPDGLGRVDNQISFTNWLASFGVQLAADVPLAIAGYAATHSTSYSFSVPFTIWTPSTVTVTCGTAAPRNPGISLPPPLPAAPVRQPPSPAPRRAPVPPAPSPPPVVPATPPSDVPPPEVLPPPPPPIDDSSIR